MSLSKLLPSIMPLVLMVTTMLEPALQGWMSQHTTALTVALSLLAILNHALPSSMAKPQLPPEAQP
jgi:hypothetical protein